MQGGRWVALSACQNPVGEGVADERALVLPFISIALFPLGLESDGEFTLGGYRLWSHHLPIER